MKRPQLNEQRASRHALPVRAQHKNVSSLVSRAVESLCCTLGRADFRSHWNAYAAEFLTVGDRQKLRPRVLGANFPSRPAPPSLKKINKMTSIEGSTEASLAKSRLQVNNVVYIVSWGKRYDL